MSKLIVEEPDPCTYTKTPVDRLPSGDVTVPPNRLHRRNWRPWKLWASMDATIEKKKTDLSKLFK